MSNLNISIPGGQTKRLLTGGKYCPENILVTAGKVKAPVEKDVNFFDFDGTLLYSYTLEEARSLSELPAGPDWHEDLAFHSWNWELTAIQALTIPMDIGAMYCTKDGATIMEVALTEDELSVTVHFSQTAENGTTWDFGDGSARETPAAAQTQSITHQFTHPGRYRIKVFSNSGTYTLGHTATGYNAFGMYAQQYYYASFLRKLHMGKNSRMRQWAFARCNYLEQVTLNPEVTYYNVSTYGMAYCTNLTCVHLPNGEIPNETFSLAFNYSLSIVTYGNLLVYFTANSVRGDSSLKRISALPGVLLSENYHCYDNKNLQSVPAFKTTLSNVGAFYNCSSLKEVSLAETSTGVAANMLNSCQSLSKVVLPAGITDIGAQAFNGCIALKNLQFQSATPPAVANVNAFNGIPATCVVEVPADSLTVYQEATNYGTIAAQMVGV